MGTDMTSTNNELTLETINGFSRQALQDWIFARLHGNDTLFSVNAKQNESSSDLIERVYPDLDRHVREDISNIVTGFVHDMAVNTQSLWQREAAHELLLLAQSVCTAILIDDLIEMAEAKRFFSPDEQDRGNDLHYRVLQTLLALGWCGRPEFWQRQVSLSPDRYIGVAFNALLPLHLQDALDLLVHVPWTMQVQERVLRSLPGWMDRYRQAGIADLLAQALPQMDRSAQRAIRSNLERNGIILPNVAKARRMKWSDVLHTKRSRLLFSGLGAAVVLVLALYLGGLVHSQWLNRNQSERKIARLQADLGAVRQQIAELSQAIGSIQLDVTPSTWIDIREIATKRENLSGNPAVAVPFDLDYPVACIIESTRPTFRWQPLERASRYKVEIRDLMNGREFASPDTITDTNWPVTGFSLQRGHTYSWVVVAMRDGQEVHSYQPPLRPARFKVLDDASVQALQHASDSSLAQGILYTQLGMPDEGERHLRDFCAKNPNSTYARNLLDKLQAVNRQIRSQSDRNLH